MIRQLIKFVTVCSTIVCVCALFELSILIFRRNSMLKEKSIKVTLRPSCAYSCKYKTPPPNYLRYMELWIFHNLASRVHFISDVETENKDLRTVLFKVEDISNAEKLKNAPFGEVKLDGTNLQWTIIANTNNYGTYSCLDTCTHIKMNYLMLKSNGFFAILNSKQIHVEYQNNEEWRSLLENNFYYLKQEIKLEENIFLCGVSDINALLRCKTLKKDIFIIIKCDEETIISY